MKKILVVVGTRPNFVKIALFKSIAARYGFDLRIVHTGQHYDANLAEIFFTQLQITPDYFLDIPATEGEQQVILIQARLSKLMAVTFKPDLVMVVGDVNSTRAAAEAAHIHNIPIAHVESGLRSFDQTMPEEINRIVADNLATYYFITEQSGLDNLRNEGKPHAHLYLVGNTMIDTLMHFQDAIAQHPILDTLNLTKGNYVLLTMHRPSNVDTAEGLQRMIDCIAFLAQQSTVVFPVHPRTYKRLTAENKLAALTSDHRVRLIEPLDYFAFQQLIAQCKFIVTDSGGIQEEATFRRKPCLTMRPNTERPVTISLGTNTLVGNSVADLEPWVNMINRNTYKTGEIPPLWDGHATERIFQILDGLR